MPKDLINGNFLEAEIVGLNEKKPGDLIFFYGMSRFKVHMITHV